ncbi:hypothetical protein AX17_001538 [Amanita inopinata Kibby_2008]|nr:hypothetical protein AX17_001538 [Amanita inopinata Kibby_2008]
MLPSTFNVNVNAGVQQTFLPHGPYVGLQVQGTDPNSPEVFRQNLQIVQQQVMQLQALARSALAGIQNAYHPGMNPAQTQADLTNLKHAIQVLLDLMRQTGVGALPLLPLPTEAAPHIAVPSEEQLMEDTVRGIKVLFEKQKRSQDAAAVVANLMGVSELGRSTGAGAGAGASASGGGGR